MSEKGRGSVGLFVGLALLAGVAAWFSLRREKPEAQLDTPESAVPYICLDDQTVLQVTPADFEQFMKSGKIKTTGKALEPGAFTALLCPKCSKFRAVPAVQCRNDQTYFPRSIEGGKPGKCPKCGWSFYATD